MTNKQAVSRSDADVSLGASGYLVRKMGLESSVHLAVRPALLLGRGMLLSDPTLQALTPAPLWNLFIIYSCSGRSARTPPAGADTPPAVTTRENFERNKGPAKNQSFYDLHMCSRLGCEAQKCPRPDSHAGSIIRTEAKKMETIR